MLFYFIIILTGAYSMTPLKLCTFNVNGIRQIHKKELLQAFLEKESPDILCLQEIKTASLELIPVLSKYQIVAHSVGQRKGYAGVVTFARKGLLVEATTAHIELLPEQSIYEGRVCMAIINNTCVINVYTPNSGADDLKRLNFRVDTWDPQFLTYLNACKKTFKNRLIVCGDFNVARTPSDIARPKSNVNKAGYTERERSSFEKCLKETELIDTFRCLNGPEKVEYTYWSYMNKARENNVGWRIDYFLATDIMQKHIKKYQCFKNALGSDHCPVVITLHL